MSRPAIIYGHPASIHSPEDVAKMEQDTGRRAIITRQGIRLDPVTDDPYDKVERESRLSDCGHMGDAA